jgi:transcriptional regulator with XRE-family HTH domain
MRAIGQLIQQRREAMGLSQASLSREMGGYPSASLMSRIESGDVELTPSSAAKYAQALRLPHDLFMNAAGLATPGQNRGALEGIEKMLGQDVPVFVSLPVLDADFPDLMLPRMHRTKEMRRAEDAFIVDLIGKQHAPYEGEVMALRDRKPKEGNGVVAEVSGKLGAWTFHTSRPTGDWLESGTQEKVTKFKVWGVIARVQPPALDLE